MVNICSMKVEEVNIKTTSFSCHGKNAKQHAFEESSHAQKCKCRHKIIKVDWISIHSLSII